jgi:hypothetical protein
MKQPSQVRAATKKHVILFLAANPPGTRRLSLDEEAHSIHVELKRSGHRDRFEGFVEATARRQREAAVGDRERMGSAAATVIWIGRWLSAHTSRRSRMTGGCSAGAVPDSHPRSSPRRAERVRALLGATRDRASRATRRHARPGACATGHRTR